jgi:hypothetical protein
MDRRTFLVVAGSTGLPLALPRTAAAQQPAAPEKPKVLLGAGGKPL